jgi:hypothetical protein
MNLENQAFRPSTYRVPLATHLNPLLAGELAQHLRATRGESILRNLAMRLSKGKVIEVAHPGHSLFAADRVGFVWTDFGGGLFDERPTTQLSLGRFVLQLDWLPVWPPRPRPRPNAR